MTSTSEHEPRCLHQLLMSDQNQNNDIKTHCSPHFGFDSLAGKTLLISFKFNLLHVLEGLVVRLHLCLYTTKNTMGSMIEFRYANEPNKTFKCLFSLKSLNNGSAKYVDMGPTHSMYEAI